MPVTPFKTIQFEDDTITYICPTWNELEDAVFTISTQIKDQNLEIDRVVTLAKGGWPMARSLVDFLEVSEVASIGVKFYKGVNQRYDQPVVYQDLPVSVENETVLLFDDVADTGGSLLFVKEYLQEKGVRKLYTATLFYKPHSVVKPEFYAEETSAWIIFPYEHRESVRQLYSTWQKQGVSNAEARSRCLDLGFQIRDFEGIL